MIAISFLKAGVELAGGDVSLVGDQVTMRADDARMLVLRGCADFVARSA
jgi:hypothetical protein